MTNITKKEKELELEVKTLNILTRQAEILLKSKLLPKQLDTPEKIIVLLMRAKELNIPPLEAINNLYIVDQHVTTNAQEMLAMIYRSGKLEKLELIGDDTYAKCIMKRQGIDVIFEYTFTIEDAKRADLLRKDNWQKYPKEMLKARAISGCARKVFPDIIGGLYTKEELEEVSKEEVSKEALPKEVLPPQQEKEEEITLTDYEPLEDETDEPLEDETNEPLEEIEDIKKDKLDLSDIFFFIPAITSMNKETKKEEEEKEEKTLKKKTMNKETKEEEEEKALKKKIKEGQKLIKKVKEELMKAEILTEQQYKAIIKDKNLNKLEDLEKILDELQTIEYQAKDDEKYEYDEDEENEKDIKRGTITDRQITLISILRKKLNNEELYKMYLEEFGGKEIKSKKELNKEAASRMIEAMNAVLGFKGRRQWKKH